MLMVIKLEMGPLRFERRTFRLSAERSTWLSYGPVSNNTSINYKISLLGLLFTLHPNYRIQIIIVNTGAIIAPNITLTTTNQSTRSLAWGRRSLAPI